MESYISLLNILNNNGLSISLDELKNENLYFKFVFNRAKFENNPNLLVAFKSNQEQWKKHYSSIYKSIEFIDDINFIKKYNLNEKTIQTYT